MTCVLLDADPEPDFALWIAVPRYWASCPWSWGPEVCLERPRFVPRPAEAGEEDHHLGTRSAGETPSGVGEERPNLVRLR